MSHICPRGWQMLERVCCLLVLNLVSSTPPCIRQPGPCHFITHTRRSQDLSVHHSHSPLPPSQESVPSRERGRGRGRGEGGGHGTLWRWVRGQGGGNYKDESRCCLGHSCSLFLPCRVCVHSFFFPHAECAFFSFFSPIQNVLFSFFSHAECFLSLFQRQMFVGNIDGTLNIF